MSVTLLENCPACETTKGKAVLIQDVSKEIRDRVQVQCPECDYSAVYPNPDDTLDDPALD